MQLSEQIQSYIQNRFETYNMVPSDDQIYEHFQSQEPSEHLIEKEIHYFFNSYEIYQDTRIEWEGNIESQITKLEVTKNEAV
jgi:hypothetical protein